MDPLAFPPSKDYDLSFLEEIHEEEEEEEVEPDPLLLRPIRPQLSPPAHGYPDEGGVPRPDFVLIEQTAYFVDRDNATTASCQTTDPLKGRIKVTFCTATPPLVSYYCVHANAYGYNDFITDPHILVSETDGGLMLLCLIIGRSQSDFFRPSCRHYFVYDSGTGRRPPSLKHIPHPGATLEFNGSSLAIVRHCNNTKKDHDCNDCDYVIVARDCDYGYESPSYLWIYQSKTEHWSAKPVQPPAAYNGHITSKTITVGGGMVAWVDLSRDIIFCDVLAENPRCRVVSLPLSIEKLPDPRSVRDIAILDGCINYVELQHQINKDGTVDSWSAAKWSMKMTNPSEGWNLDHKVYSSSISGSSKLEGNALMAQPDLRRLFVGLPNLSFQDNDVVYCLAKIHYWDSEHTSWVIIVDLRDNTIHEVVEYNAIKTLGLSLGYRASRISRYLRGARGTCLTEYH